MKKIISVLMILMILAATVTALPIAAEGEGTGENIEENVGGDTGNTEEKPSVDFSKLDAKIAEVEALDKKEWHSRYFLYLSLATEEAKKLKDKEDVTQYQINDALQKIEKAQANLVPKPTPTPLEEITLEEYEKWINEGLQIYDGEIPKHTMRPKPTKPTAPTPANIVTKKAGSKDSGCGSLVGGAALIAISVAVVGTCVALKKKED